MTENQAGLPEAAELDTPQTSVPTGFGGAAGAALGVSLHEVLLDADSINWEEKSLPGLSQKMLWRNEQTGASIALVRFEQGVGIPSSHAHASNQFMFCLSGRYRYVPTGVTLTPGSFYWNPNGFVHGPTVADEPSVLLEIYDGAHYPVKPDWYDNDEDAR